MSIVKSHDSASVNWRKRLGVPAAAFGLAVAIFAVAPAVAKPPPAGIWEQYHFKDAKGQIHTVTEAVQIVRADYAETACNVDLPKHGAAGAQFEVTKYPELATMTFVSADCETDKTGAPKVAVGGWPAGKGPTTTRAEITGFSPKPTPALFDGPPAVILFTASVDGGKVVKGYGGWQGGVPALYARTCEAKLPGQLPVIVNTLRDRYHFSSAKILNAKCAPFPKNYGDLLNASNASN